MTGNREQKRPETLTKLVGKTRNGYIGFRAKIVRLSEVAAMLGTQKEVGSGPSRGVYLFRRDQISCG
jgi:hypothetical protein